MRSNPTRFLLSYFWSFSFYLLTYFTVFFCLFFFLFVFSLDIFSRKMVSYLQISPVLNVNASFHLFLCCLFLYFDFFFELKKYSVTLVHGYKPCEIMIIKRNNKMKVSRNHLRLL